MANACCRCLALMQRIYSFPNVRLSLYALGSAIQPRDSNFTLTQNVRWKTNSPTQPLSNSDVSLSHNTLPGKQAEQGHPFSTSIEALEQDDRPDFSLIEHVNEQISSEETGRLFAVVHILGKQRKITAEDIIVMPRHIEADIGERIRLNKVLMVGGKDFTIIGRPILHADAARVEATVIEKTLASNKIIYWYKRRKNIKHFRLRSQMETYLRINSIEVTPVNK